MVTVGKLVQLTVTALYEPLVAKNWLATNTLKPFTVNRWFHEVVQLPTLQILEQRTI